MNQNTNTMNFTTISQARKDTGISYIGNVNHSSKLKKNGKISGQLTYGVYLAPAKESGYQVCPNATKECKLGCLNTSGRAGIEIFSGKTMIKDARIKRTRLFFEHNEYFMAWLIAEIKAKRAKAKRDNLGFSVRLNATSDIDWQNTYYKGYNVFEIFPDVIFYDYTKNVKKFINKPDNYHLTFSYTGRNWDKCKVVLEQGNNVAMVFNVKKETEIPAMYKGYDVINGDITDYRVDDAKGIIVGLKWKRIANRVNEQIVLNSCFVVDPQKITNPIGELYFAR
jgi:hypothetical protein